MSSRRRAAKKQKGAVVADGVAAPPRDARAEGRSIVFLDVDGVLLPFGDAAPPPPDDGGFPVEPLAALSHLLSSTGAELVLSSTWRSSMEAVNELTSAFFFFASEYGGPLGDITFSADTHMTSLDNHSVRQWEIAEWLASPAAAGVTRWVALDDEELLRGDENARNRAAFEGHVVHTLSHVGLTHELADAAIALLQARQRPTHEAGGDDPPPARREAQRSPQEERVAASERHTSERIFDALLDFLDRRAELPLDAPGAATTSQAGAPPRPAQKQENVAAGARPTPAPAPARSAAEGTPTGGGREAGKKKKKRDRGSV